MLAPKRDATKGPTPGGMGFATLFTVASGIGAFFIALAVVKASYREEHGLEPVRRSFLFWNETVRAQVKLEWLGTTTVLGLVVGAAVYTLVVHPLLGRLVQRMAASLTNGIVSVYRLDEQPKEWDPDTAIIFGATWPVTLLSIPVLAVALLTGTVYRALWR